MTKEKGLYYLVPDTAPIKIARLCKEKNIVYGTREYNGYPWVIAAGEKRILFTCAHCLCDGMGAVAFLKTVLALYLTERGLLPKGEAGALSPEAVLRTVEDSFAKNAAEESWAPYSVGKKKKASPIPGRLFEKDREKAALYRFRIQKDEIKKLAAETETTTFAVIASVLAKSLARALNKEKGNINVLLPVNLRGLYGSETDRGFTYTAQLNYPIEKCMDKPLFFSSTAFRSQLDAVIDRDYFDFVLAQDKKRMELLIRHPFLLKLAKSAFYGMLYSPRASIVYTHLTRPFAKEAITPFIEDFYIGGAARPSPLIVAMASTFGEEISVTMGQSIKNEALIAAMRGVLAELGVSYRVEKAEKMPAIYYRS